MQDQKVKTRICDLDSRDPLWTEHKGSPFPTVAEAIQEDLDKYRYLQHYNVVYMSTITPCPLSSAK